MKRVRNNKRIKLLKDIAIAVVVAIIVNLLQQLYNNFPQIGKSLFATIQNYVFSSAANASSNTIIIMIFEMILGFVFSFSISHLVNSFVFYKDYKKIQNYKNTIKEIELSISNNPSNNEANKLRLQKVSKELESYSENLKNKGINRRKLNVILSVFAVIIALYVVYITISIVIPVFLFDQFNRDLTMIKPYTDSRTIMLIESDWTRMKTADDYNAIYSNINKVKLDNSLT